MQFIKRIALRHIAKYSNKKKWPDSCDDINGVTRAEKNSFGRGAIILKQP